MKEKKSVSEKPKPAGAWEKNFNQGTLYGWPMGLWFALFFIAPLAIIFV